MNAIVRGVVAAVPTALGPTGVDENGVRRIAGHLIANAVDALWVLGSGGEFALLTPAQQLQVVNVVAEEARGRVPVIMGTGDSDTSRSCAAARQARDAGAQFVFAMAPFYYSCSSTELERHFQLIAEAADLPVILYNNPWNTRVSLPIELVAKLSRNACFNGIKDSSADWDYFIRLLNAVPRDASFSVLQGNELSFGPSVLMGADGGVNALSVIEPKLFRDLFEAATRRDVGAVRTLQATVAELFQIYVSPGRTPDSAFLCNQKIALELLGLCSRIIPEPFEAATEEEIERVQTILQTHGLLASAAV